MVRRPPLLALAMALSAPWAAHAEPAGPEQTASSGLLLRVEPRGTELPWRLVVENRGTAPVELVADARLLELSVAVPGRRKPARCRLPEELVPAASLRRQRVVLAPGASRHAEFDPRVYCWSNGGQDVLVPGAVVTPRFGFAASDRTRWQGGRRVPVPEVAPFVATRVGEERGEKAITGPPFALDSRHASWSATRLPSSDAEPAAPLLLELLAGSDAESERGVTVEVVLRNVSGVPQRVFLRRDHLRFEVVSDRGRVACVPEPSNQTPSEQAFSRLAPGGRESYVTRLRELCPPGTFAEPGLYWVHASAVLTESGEPFGLDAFTGVLAALAPRLVRVRTGMGKVRPRPLLPVEEAPAPPPPRRDRPGRAR